MGIFTALKKQKQKTDAAAPGAVTAEKAEKKAKAADTHEHAPVVLPKGSRAGRVLRRTHVSEKTAIAETTGKYTFIVDTHTNKTEVKRAIKEIYGILPVAVRMVNVEGKPNRTGRRSDWKKAIVQLPKGKTISIHEGV